MSQARRILAVAAAVALVVTLGFFASVQAGSDSKNISITASVSKNCTLTAGSVAFGAYDPVVANASADLDATGSFTVACTKGATGAWIDLDLGANPTGSTRRLKAGAEYLTYELYKDSGYTTIWGTGDPGASGNGKAVAAPANKNPVAVSIYGRVAGAQDVGVGSYTDTIVATVNF